jgi:hypothetical protein
MEPDCQFIDKMGQLFVVAATRGCQLVDVSSWMSSFPEKIVCSR